MADKLHTMLGKRVATLRKQAAMSQAALADKVPTAIQVISRLERGVAVPSLGKLARVAEALGVDMRDLFTFDEPKAGASQAAIERVVGILRRQPIKRIELIRRIATDVIESCM